MFGQFSPRSIRKRILEIRVSLLSACLLPLQSTEAVHLFSTTVIYLVYRFYKKDAFSLFLNRTRHLCKMHRVQTETSILQEEFGGNIYDRPLER